MAERRILDLQQQAAVRHGLGEYTFDSWHAATQHGKDSFELSLVLLGQVLDHVGEIVAGLAQALARTGLSVDALDVLTRAEALR